MRRRINSIEPLDRALHLYSNLVLLLNIFFILYAMISLTSRMLQNGVPFIDSLPLAFYILPLLIFLPKLLLDYYRSRSAIFTIVILLIVAIVFGMISTLVRGFTILVVLNIASIVLVIVLGRFRPTVPLRSIGRKGVAWFLILNSLGLMLPVSVYLMGQYPIATATYSDSTTIYLEMPLSSFEYQFVNITPTASLLLDLEDSGFGVDLRVSAQDLVSLTRLSTWLLALSNSTVPYRITISSDRESFSMFDSAVLGTTSLIASHYQSILSIIENVLVELDDMVIPTNNLMICADMRLSQIEWVHLMDLIGTVDLQGFSSLVRRSLDAIASDEFTNLATLINTAIAGRDIDLSFIVEGFVIDDLLDGDITMMK
ncbi:MAG: hypothetical protein P1Q69_20415, partial [Candidatus Thorarchaeota archaeon]|nr:hypothetical protein [Candidatus Thorarchaeota archaeon]